MANSADIETVLVKTVAEILYPPVGLAFATQVSVARGWPTEADIRQAVNMNMALVGIYAVENLAKDATITLRCWKTLSPGIGVMEVGRIEQVFKIDIWAPNPDSRDALLKTLEPALKFQTRYKLTDGSVATLMKLQANGPDDRPARADEWQQSLALTMQYPVLYTQMQPMSQTSQVTIIET